MYIEQIYCMNKFFRLRKFFELGFPNTDVQIEISRIGDLYELELVLRRKYKDSVVIGVFSLTDYDCVEKGNCQSYNYNIELDTISKTYFPISKVKSCYLKFMKSNFVGYKKDYIDNAIKEAEKFMEL